MDLHVVGPAATADERAAIDAVLDPVIGPARGGWDGGVRQIDADGRAARGGHEARSRRDLLLPALHAAQARTGWVSRGALNHISRRLSVPPADAYGVATFYALFATRETPPAVAHVCDDVACRAAGAEAMCEDLGRALGPAGAPALGGSATWKRSPCLGRCELAPATLITVAGAAPETVSLAPVDAAGIIARLEAAAAGRRVRAADPDGHPDLRHSVPQLGDPGLRLLARVGRADPTSLDAYRATGGYEALARAVANGPGWLIEEVTAAGLVGRGGAAFPTGRKWAAVAGQPAQPRYLVCNADESEPGTFKDRVVMEEDPFAVIEAMTLEAFAVGASHGYLYVRGEYPLAESRMSGAIRAARGAGLLGDDILGSGFSFDIEIRRGAGAYICGEETALFESIEGKRGEPRNKPPFPVEVGLFGKPTAVNNVETLVNVPLIVRDGATAWRALGTEGSPGPKLFCLSGHVARPGLYEVEFGATLGEVLTLAGGVAGADRGRSLQAVLLGGAAGVFVGPDALRMPLTFEGTRAAGATLGSGVVMAFDDTVDLPGILRRIAAFFRDESCGQCVPCRVGTVRQEELLARLASGRPSGGIGAELRLLADIGRAMRDASICGLGQTASSAIESAVRAGLVRFDAGGTGTPSTAGGHR
jgi:NADH-quinone oxidoreductase subunit F